MELSAEEILQDLTRLDAECQCSQPCDCKYLNDNILQIALTAAGKESIFKRERKQLNKLLYLINPLLNLHTYYLSDWSTSMSNV